MRSSVFGPHTPGMPVAIRPETSDYRHKPDPRTPSQSPAHRPHRGHIARPSARTVRARRLRNNRMRPLTPGRLLVNFRPAADLWTSSIAPLAAATSTPRREFELTCLVDEIPSAKNIRPTCHFRCMRVEHSILAEASIVQWT